MHRGWLRGYVPVSSISLRTKSSEAVFDGKIEEEGFDVSATEVVFEPRRYTFSAGMNLQDNGMRLILSDRIRIKLILRFMHAGGIIRHGT